MFTVYCNGKVVAVVTHQELADTIIELYALVGLTAWALGS